MRVLMRGFSTAALLGATLVAAPNVGAARTQLSRMSQRQGMQLPQTSPLPQTSQRRPSITDPDGQPPPDPLAIQLAASRARAMANERQKRIVDDTARVLQLATELNTDVEKVGRDEMQLEMARKADEIERLAHEVKQRMKG